MYKLKISRRDSNRVPFSVVYLYQEDERTCVRAAFPALFELQPLNLRIEDWETVCIHTQDPSDRTVRCLGHDARAPKFIDVVPDFFTADSPWYLAVPVLTVTGSTYGDPGPDDPHDIPDMGEPPIDHKKLAYMGSGGNWKTQRNSPPLPEPRVFLDPVFAVQGQEDVGVCSSCPRYAHNAAGKCFFGDKVCFKHVRALGAPTFIQHLSQAPKDHDGLPQRQPDADHATDEST